MWMRKTHGGMVTAETLSFHFGISVSLDHDVSETDLSECLSDVLTRAQQSRVGQGPALLELQQNTARAEFADLILCRAAASTPQETVQWLNEFLELLLGNHASVYSSLFMRACAVSAILSACSQ